jgi:L-amino acid N-acyltransferase YncA
MLEEEYETRRVLPSHLRPPPPPEPMFSFELRAAVETDIPNVREIYNHYVMNSSVTFDESPMTLSEWRRKFAKISKLGMPFVVAVSPSGNMLGFAFVMPWSDKAAFRKSVEDSIYLGPAATGKGLGRVLLGDLLVRSKNAGLKEMVAVIADKGADASIHLHESYGFKIVGQRGKVGYKYGRWLGNVFMQKKIK